MKPLPLLILWGLGFLLIVVLCLRFSSSLIENELIQKTHHALASEGFHTVKASANGQTVTLQGSTTSDANRQQAESTTQAINGVNAVDNQLTITVAKQTHHKPDHKNHPTLSTPESKPTGVYPPTPLPTEQPVTHYQVNDGNNTNTPTLPNTPPNRNNPSPWHYPSSATPWGNNNGVMPYPYPPSGHSFVFPFTPQAPLPPIAPMPPMPPVPPVMPFNTWMR